MIRGVWHRCPLRGDRPSGSSAWWGTECPEVPFRQVLLESGMKSPGVAVPASGRGHLSAGWQRRGRSPGPGACATGSLSWSLATWLGRGCVCGRGSREVLLVLWSSGPGLPCLLSPLEGRGTGGSQAWPTLSGCVVGTAPGRGPCPLLGPGPAPLAASVVLTADCRGQRGRLGVGRRAGLPARRGLGGLWAGGLPACSPLPRASGVAEQVLRMTSDGDVSLLSASRSGSKARTLGRASPECHQGRPREGTSAPSLGEAVHVETSPSEPCLPADPCGLPVLVPRFPRRTLAAWGLAAPRTPAEGRQ